MKAPVTVVGLDIAKSVFQAHGTDADGKTVLKKRLKRADVEIFFRELPRCLIALEACPGAHFWGRLLREIGHEVRLLPAQYVKPYVKTNKSDAADAEAICEAVTRPTMRFVPIKEEGQQEILVLHRVRDMLVRQRTQLINAIRGHMTEFGLIAPKEAKNIKILTTLIEDEAFEELPSTARHALGYLVEQLHEIKAKLYKIGRDMLAIAKNNDACRRLMTIPGVGTITASALVSSINEPGDFKSGRHFAAWIGLVPRQNSSGSKERLGGISKRGNIYLRRLLIHGSRAVMRWRGESWAWLASLKERRPANVAAVAIANKTARIVWSILRFGGIYQGYTNAASTVEN